MEIGSKQKVFFLPFAYFYVLSIALIFVGAYLLAKLPETNSRLTFAQSENELSSSPVQIDLSSAEYDSVMVAELDTGVDGRYCDPIAAEKIEKYFSKYNAPLKDHGCDFVFHATENNINPYLVAAIGMCESTGGKVTPQFGGTESFNAWGWAVMDSNDTTREVNGYACDSWEHCIGRVTRGIARKAERGLEPKDIVMWYNPGSVDRAAGVPENSTWTTCVSDTMKKIEAQ